MAKRSATKTYKVPCLLGDGTEEVMLEVRYLVGGMPIGVDGACAFCHGDPCGEAEGESGIKSYMKRNPWAETCPVCEGRGE